MAQLRSVTCHMGSHSVTCYPTQVNIPRLNPSHAGRYSIYLPRRDGRLSWPSWLDSARAGSRTCDLSITSPTLNQRNHQDNMAWLFARSTNVYGSRPGELEGIGSAYGMGLKVVKLCSSYFLTGHFLFTCSDTFAVVLMCRFSHSAQRQRISGFVTTHYIDIWTNPVRK